MPDGRRLASTGTCHDARRTVDGTLAARAAVSLAEGPRMSDVLEFRNDDVSYLRWIAANPAGTVLNVPCRSGVAIVRHIGACRTISSDKGGNWTGPNYYKVVAVTPHAIQAWIRSSAAAEVRACGICARNQSRGNATRSRRRSVSSVPAPDHTRSAPQASVINASWSLWSMGPPLAVLGGIDPQIASWDHKEHANQVRLKAYLSQVKAHFASVVARHDALALSLTIDLKREERLYRGNDVENYVTPLVHGLGGRKFVYADVEKQVGGGSHIAIGPAVPRYDLPAAPGWSGRVAGNLGTSAGKRAIREQLVKCAGTAVPPGPATVHMAWRLRASANWVGLWKPTGDAMGPVVGESRYPEREFHPDDDRITRLTLHRCIDDSLPVGVIDVGLWWGLAKP